MKQSSKSKPVSSSSSCVPLLHCLLACVGVCACVFGLYPATQPSYDSRLFIVYGVVYGSVHRTLFALCIAQIIYTCFTFPANTINRLLSHRVFVPLANVSYGSYLFNMVPIVAVYTQGPFPYTWTGHTKQMTYALLHIVLTYAFGIMLTVCIEYPFMNMERMFFNRTPGQLDNAQCCLPTAPLMRCNVSHNDTDTLCDGGSKETDSLHNASTK
jgi:peptidoglycan/LPS O-acetylase OafA/YrhL